MIATFLRRFALCMSLVYGCQSAAALSPEESFGQGIAHLDKGQIEEAIKSFQDALAAEPYNSRVIYNLGIATFKANQKGLALGLWRKALAIDPDLSKAHDALMFGAQMLQVDPHLKRTGIFGELHTKWLTLVALYQLLAVGLIALTASGWLLIGFWGRRREALENETSMPPFPSVGGALGVVALLFLSLAALKATDMWTPKATIIATQADVLSGPTEAASKLFFLREGTPVEVVRTQEQWVQIRSSASGSGWLPSTSVFITSERDLW